MVPIVLGAIAAGAVAVALGDDNSEKNFASTEKRPVSEEYVRKCLKESGKSQAEIAKLFSVRKKKSNSSGSYSKLLSQVENMLSKPRKSNEGIKQILQKAEKLVERQKNSQAMKKIADYYRQIHCTDKSEECFQKSILFDNK